MVKYTVYDEGTTIDGNARQVLEKIRQQGGARNKEIAKMNVEKYADALIEDAEYFLADDLLKVLEKQEFDSKFDRALTYLGQVPRSGVRIITIKPSRNGK
jgi:hypothetical protein